MATPKQMLIEVKFELLEVLQHLSNVHQEAQALPRGADRSEIIRTVQEARRWSEAAVSATIDVLEDA